MSCPIVPKEAPLPSLRQLQTAAKDPFYGLTQMMHTGLSHFTGRGLPTIWAFISSNQVDSATRIPAVFTETDSKVIREWARQLDDWLVQWNSKSVYFVVHVFTDASTEHCKFSSLALDYSAYETESLVGDHRSHKFQ